MNRVKLYQDKKRPDKVIETYELALKTVSPKKDQGKLVQLWLSFAKFHEESGDMESCRAVFDRAIKVHFKRVDDVTNLLTLSLLKYGVDGLKWN